MMPAVASGRSVRLSPPWSAKVYISFSTTSVYSPIARLKSAVCSTTGHADLLVAVGRQQLARAVLQPLPGADLGGQHVVHAADRLDLDRQLNLPSCAARQARVRRRQSGTARCDRSARSARSRPRGRRLRCVTPLASPSITLSGGTPSSVRVAGPVGQAIQQPPAGGIVDLGPAVGGVGEYSGDLRARRRDRVLAADAAAMRPARPRAPRRGEAATPPSARRRGRRSCRHRWLPRLTVTDTGRGQRDPLPMRQRQRPPDRARHCEADHHQHRRRDQPAGIIRLRRLGMRVRSGGGTRVLLRVELEQRLRGDSPTSSA